MRIIGSGSYIPEMRITNSDFENHNFFDNKGAKPGDDPACIIIVNVIV
jgi:3-oxoacyl-[acyl-carrier-protein] synthase III